MSLVQQEYRPVYELIDQHPSNGTIILTYEDKKLKTVVVKVTKENDLYIKEWDHEWHLVGTCRNGGQYLYRFVNEQGAIREYNFPKDFLENVETLVGRTIYTNPLHVD